MVTGKSLAEKGVVEKLKKKNFRPDEEKTPTEKTNGRNETKGSKINTEKRGTVRKKALSKNEVIGGKILIKSFCFGESWGPKGVGG